MAASAAMASDLPFIIVRGEAKEYGTAKRIEGPFEPGELVCLLEDVVTSGGALAEAVSAVRDEGLVVRNAVCVVDREEGGSDCGSGRCFARVSFWRCAKSPESGMVEPNPKGC